MSRNSNMLLAALGGAAAAALITRYLGSEDGKQMLNTAQTKLNDLSDRAQTTVRDLKDKASDFANKNLSGVGRKGTEQNVDEGVGANRSSGTYQPS
jgi:hypothetical protein